MRPLLSLSTIVTIAPIGLPKLAFATDVNETLNVSFPSFTSSLIIGTLKLFDDSPAAKNSVPETAM